MASSWSVALSSMRTSSAWHISMSNRSVLQSLPELVCGPSKSVQQACRCTIATACTTHSSTVPQAPSMQQATSIPATAAATAGAARCRGWRGSRAAANVSTPLQRQATAGQPFLCSIALRKCTASPGCEGMAAALPGAPLLADHCTVCPAVPAAAGWTSAAALQQHMQLSGRAFIQRTRHCGGIADLYMCCLQMAGGTCSIGCCAA